MVQRIESSLRLENSSEPHGEGWWKWSVWVEGTPEDLASVEAVTYRLHPTFPRPVVKVTTPGTKFKLSSAGWGEFAISADAHMNDGRTIRLERWLELGDKKTPMPGTKRPAVFLSYSITDSPVVKQLSESLSRRGIEVRTAEQATETAEDFQLQIDKQLHTADAVVAVVSDPPSRFVEQEAISAHNKGRYVLPVAIGGAHVSGPLSQFARFELADASHLEGLADQIAARVKDHAIIE